MYPETASNANCAQMGRFVYPNTHHLKNDCKVTHLIMGLSLEPWTSILIVIWIYLPEESFRGEFSTFPIFRGWFSSVPELEFEREIHSGSGFVVEYDLKWVCVWVCICIWVAWLEGSSPGGSVDWQCLVNCVNEDCCRQYKAKYCNTSLFDLSLILSWRLCGWSQVVLVSL